MNVTLVHKIYILMILDVNAAIIRPFRIQCPDGYTFKFKYGQLICVRKDCPAGYFGDYCEHRCRFPFFGKDCQFVCDCSSKLCDVVKGCPPPFPFCPDGYLGKYCEKKCPYPNYGQYCQQECLCSKSHCNFSSGCQIYRNDLFKTLLTNPLTKFSTHEINDKTFTRPTVRDSSTIPKKVAEHACPDGFHGTNCETPCRYPSYGTYCQKKCQCPENLCNISNGCSTSHQKGNQSYATKTSIITSVSTTGTKGLTLITSGKIYLKKNTSLSAEKMIEVKALNELEETPRVNERIIWSITLFAVLTVSLVIGHIYLTASKRLQRRGIQSP